MVMFKCRAAPRLLAFFKKPAHRRQYGGCMRSCSFFPKVWVGVVSLMAIVWILPRVQIDCSSAAYRPGLKLLLWSWRGGLPPRLPCNSMAHPLFKPRQLATPHVRGIDQFSHDLAWLGSHPSHSVATRKDATVEVVLATCHKCCFKLCLLFGPNLCQHLYSKRQLRKNHNLGTATS